MPYRSDAESVRAAWREVQLDIAAVRPESPEVLALHAEAAALLDEYRRLIDTARTMLRPEPRHLPR